MMCPHYKTIVMNKPFTNQMTWGYWMCKIFDRPCPMIAHFVAYYGREKR
jgi:hypothetical protein